MIGNEIASYRILEKLGEGGMRVVCKAVDTALDRLAAAKELNSELARNPALARRFRAEGKAQGKVMDFGFAKVMGVRGMAKTGTHMGARIRDVTADTPPIRQNFNFITQGFSRVRAAGMLEPASQGR